MTGDKEKIHQISEGVLMFVYKCSRFIIYFCEMLITLEFLTNQMSCSLDLPEVVIKVRDVMRHARMRSWDAESLN